MSKTNIDLNLIYSQYEFQIHKAYTNTLFELVNQFYQWSMEIKLLKIDDQVNAKDIGWCQYNLRVVYYKTGQLALAIKYYNSAIDRLPEEEEIIYNL
ncbi:hypothetical protein FLA4_10830 [Candidatus Rickettsia kotlanii]|nr:hypothetical protein FLA4_10830 [Candidatus Rickettsia kotlanii]BDU61916.1 hypothetical protein HM2_10840 [Candidatus Rickettsia kotlanii]